MGKSLSSNPLFSTIITLYTLILLYFPTTILFSPIFLSTSLLILSLLKLAATQKNNQQQQKQGNYEGKPNSDEGPDTERDPEFDPNPNQVYAESFIEWNVGAPLEVIHEEYYEDEGKIGVIERYASLSLYYPDTDTDTDTDNSSGRDSPVIGKWDSPENLCFHWEEEDRERLIEIELDGKRNSEDEEENLIEIDPTPA